MGQGRNFADDSEERRELFHYAALVKSGDPSNVEGRAARYYWPKLMGDKNFRRDKDGEGVNSLLNYGYSIIRASLARSIVSSGLLPAMGLHHCNRSNYFCLADDLIEPLRPIVDRQVQKLVLQGENQISPVVKKKLLEILNLPVKTAKTKGPLQIHISRLTSSLVDCFNGTAEKLEIPILCKSADTDVCGL